MVTFEALFMFCSLIVSIISLVVSIIGLIIKITKKKK